ncbi:MAG: ATP-binding protein [Magnetococcus sp. WYHC-3]
MSTLFASDQLLDQLTTGLIAVDRDNRVRQVNSVAERMLGRPREQLLGQSLKRLLPGHPVALDLIARARTSDMPVRFRRAHLNPGPGTNLTVSMCASPLVDPGTLEADGVLLQIEEIGSVELLEEDQRLHDTLDSLGHLALMVAHEVKNPLSGIRGAAQLLEMELRGQSEHAGAYTQLIRQEVDRVSKLLDNLLGLADDQPVLEQEINIHQVLDHVLQLRHTTPPALERDYDPSLPDIRGDRDQLIQLFLNLVKNAQEAAGPGGRVSVSTRISNRVRMERGRRKLHVRVDVLDNGPGIPEEMRKKIFLPFVSSKNKGSGLGLAICQKILHDHGGYLELSSQPGQTRFRIYLPTVAC